MAGEKIGFWIWIWGPILRLTGRLGRSTLASPMTLHLGRPVCIESLLSFGGLYRPPPHMVTCGLSHVWCWLAGRHHNRQHMQATRGEEKLVKSRKTALGAFRNKGLWDVNESDSFKDGKGVNIIMVVHLQSKLRLAATVAATGCANTDLPSCKPDPPPPPPAVRSPRRPSALHLQVRPDQNGRLRP